MHVDQQHICALRYIQGNHKSKKPLMQVDQSHPIHYDRQSMSNPKTIGNRLAEQNKWVWTGRREWLEEATEQGADILRIDVQVWVGTTLPGSGARRTWQAAIEMFPTGWVGKMSNECVGWVKWWAYQMDRLRMPISEVIAIFWTINNPPGLQGLITSIACHIRWRFTVKFLTINSCIPPAKQELLK